MNFRDILFFNVFPLFLCRLSKAYKPASKYMNLFISPFMAIIAKYVFFTNSFNQFHKHERFVFSSDNS